METIKAMPSKCYWSPLAIFSWIGILLPPVIYIYFVYTYSLNIPFSDDFTIMSQAINTIQATNFNEKFSALFSLNGEHRLVFLRLSYLLSYLLFEEIDFRFLTFFGNTALVALLFLFLKITKVPHSNLLYFVPVSILLFQLQTWKNMTWAQSAIEHQCIFLFTGLTFYLLNKNSNRYFLFGFFFAVVSIYTNGSGLGTIFLGWIILLINKKYRQSVVWAIGTLLLSVFYFKNFHTFTNVLSGTESLAGLKNLLIYFFSFLGSALSLNNLQVAFGCGVALSFYLCFLTWEKYFKKNSTVYMFMVFIFIYAAMVAIARSDLGVENVFAPRYKVASVILICLVYMSLAEKFYPSADKFRNLAVIGILITTISYYYTFETGRLNLETRNKSLAWLTNQWINTNHGFFYTPGEPGTNDRTPNSILLKAVEGKFYQLPYKILSMPDKGYSSSANIPKGCEAEKRNAFKAKFSVIRVGPESNPYLIRLEGIIHSPASDKIENKATIHLILKSKDGSYIFETHPQSHLRGSVFYDARSSNAGFIALLPTEKIESGLYRLGFCYGGFLHFEDRALSIK